MNCDEAFDALTSRDSHQDSELRWHLEFCPRCRQMQEVLAPALELIGDASESEPAMMQPISRPLQRESDDGDSLIHTPRFLTTEAIQEAEHVAAALAPRKRKTCFSTRRLMLAAVLFGVGVLGWFSFVTPSQNSSGTNAGDQSYLLADHCLWKEPKEANVLGDVEQEQSAKWVVLSCVSCHIQ